MKILLTSVSAGAGHVRAAEAIEAALRISHPRAQVSHLNVMDYVTKPFRLLYEGGYVFLANRCPSVWGALYKATDKGPLEKPLKPLMNFLQRINAGSFLNEVDRFSPDVIVTTHFLIPQLLSSLIKNKKITARLDCVVTDYVLHSFWMDPMIRTYYVAHDGMVADLVERGFSRDKAVVAGIPIDPVFSKPTEPAGICQKMELQADSPILLVLSGGLGFGAMDQTVQKLFELKGSAQIITVSGKNEELKKRMDQLNAPPHLSLRNLGFVKNMDELLAVSDLVIGKAGGLTVSEGLAKGVGMIFFGILPGQEETNAAYVESRGAGRLVSTLDELLSAVQGCLDDPHLISSMKKNASRAAKPKAALMIVDNLIIPPVS